MERLAELAFQAGDMEAVNRLRTRKAELDRARAEYEQLLLLPGSPGPSPRLAHLAESLQSAARGTAPLDGGPGRTSGRPARRWLAWLRSRRSLPPSVPADATLPQLLAYLDRLRTDQPTERGRDGLRLPAALPTFQDDAGAAGLSFTFDNGAEPLHHLPEIYSGGVGTARL